MDAISRLEQADGLDGLVAAGQRVARLIPPGRIRDALHGTWLGHPLHPMLVQVTAGTWLSASILDLSAGDLGDGCVTCPWHGSSFRLSDGKVVRGPATAPQPVFEIRVTDGMLDVRLPGAG